MPNYNTFTYTCIRTYTNVVISTDKDKCTCWRWRNIRFSFYKTFRSMTTLLLPNEKCVVFRSFISKAYCTSKYGRENISQYIIENQSKWSKCLEFHDFILLCNANSMYMNLGLNNYRLYYPLQLQFSKMHDFIFFNVISNHDDYLLSRPAFQLHQWQHNVHLTCFKISLSVLRCNFSRVCRMLFSIASKWTEHMEGLPTKFTLNIFMH